MERTDQLPNWEKPVLRFLSRFGVNRSLTKRFRANTASAAKPASVPTPDNTLGDEKGQLGLTTLYEPSPPTIPVADIVFIHGLGGGSRKTWSYSADPRYFWPLLWLPADDEFRHVRIHTFGYMPAWTDDRQNVLNIHGIAHSLFGALQNHPGVRQKATGIVFVGHGVGGYVAKKAYILARQDPAAAADFAGRVHSIFFLATPHRSSNLAGILEDMLGVRRWRKPFTPDLSRNAAVLHGINDEFRHVAPTLRLWSFYETLPTRRRGAKRRFVVDIHSATLGYHNEEIAGMDADHRRVCAFETPADPNYKVLRNALLTAVDMTQEGNGGTTSHSSRASLVGPDRSAPPTSDPPISPAQEMLLLRSFLGVPGPPEGDLATLQLLKQPGSCKWFTEKPSFASWQAGTAPRILWLVGRPGTGKSVLASHVIEQLQPPHGYCSYFIFTHANTGDSTLSYAFRSLSYQMAMQDDLVKDALVQLVREGLTLDPADDANVWRRLFTGCIFKLSSITQHFWVIDGMDECTNFQILFTNKLLATLPDKLRLFATSRNLEAIERALTSLGPTRANIQVLSDIDTVEDMRLFVTSGLTKLGRPETPESRERMCENIVDRSTGSFLWTQLVLQGFQRAWTDELMEDVLRKVPTDLFKMYLRMVESIDQSRHKLPLAKSILTWVVLASRPLTTDEMKCAVKLDTNQTLLNPVKAIPELCGQLVFFDKHNQVVLIHETVRGFLLDETLGLALTIHKQDGHARLASLALGYLTSGALQPLQDKAPLSNMRPKGKGFARSVAALAPANVSLLHYASRFFSEHLCRATSSDDKLMGSLSNFLGTNHVLAWIEHIARSGDLAPLSQTALNLRQYLGRRLKHVPPTDKSAQLVDGWATDLIHVAARFHAELLACPSSIHYLIPSLCPSESMIARTFGRGSQQSQASSGFVVNGLPPGPWDDCLVQLDFEHGQTTALGHGEGFFAIGLSTGQISLYDPDYLQVIRQLKHPESVHILAFSQRDAFLASCGAKHLIIWDPKSGAALHSFSLPSTTLAITFMGVDEVLGAFESSELTKWELATGEQQTISWKDGDCESYSPVPNIMPTYPPSHAAFLTISPDQVLLAVGYRDHPVLIWNALKLELLGICQPDITDHGLAGIMLSPNPQVPMLVVSYQEGSLCIFDYTTMEMWARRPDVYATAVSCSSDGRTIITGSGQGGIEVFELEEADYGRAVTLNRIYRSNHPLDDPIQAVALSHDGLRFVDVRGRQGRVWAPPALVRKSRSEVKSSGSISNPIRSLEAEPTLLPATKPSEMLDIRDSPKITSALVSSADGKFVIAGKSNGDIVVFSTADAKQLGTLYQHEAGASIIALAFIESRNLVVSADDDGRVRVAELQLSLSKVGTFSGPTIASIILDQRFGGAVVSVLANAAGDRILVHGQYEDQVWAISSGEAFLFQDVSNIAEKLSDSAELGSKVDAHDKSTAAGTCLRSVFQHPSNLEWFVTVTRDIARIYSWADVVELTSPGGIQLVRESTSAVVSLPSSLSSPFPGSIPWETAASSYHPGPNSVIELFRPTPTSSARLFLWPAAELDPNTTTSQAKPATEPNLTAIGPAVSSLLRIVGPSTVYFLDVNRWVCSVELQSATVSVSGAALSTSTPVVSPSASPLPSLDTASSTSVTTVSAPRYHARRHFFALREWCGSGSVLAITPGMMMTTPGGTVSRAGGGGKGVVEAGRDVVRKGRDMVVFAVECGIVVVQGGLEFVEEVVVAADEGRQKGSEGECGISASFVGGYSVWRGV